MSCNFGQAYTCNPKYIAEAVNRMYPGYFDIVLLMQKKSQDVPSYIRQVRYRSIAAQREWATARFWLCNFRNDKKYVPKRSDQIYIQTWHGALTAKQIEKDVENKLDRNYVKDAQYDGSITDLLFANNDLFERVFNEKFWYSGPVVRCGIPRNKPLTLANESISTLVHDSLGVSGEVAICLYAPTFRADLSMDKYRFDFDKTLEALERRFSKKFQLVYRLHPNLIREERPSFLAPYIDATNYPDSQELLAATDVLISDYSSVLEDFALTGKPGFVFAPDIESYLLERGFYYSLYERPFPVATTDDELLSKIERFDEEEYRNSLDSFFRRFNYEDDGYGDERIAEIIYALSKKGTKVLSAIDELHLRTSKAPMN